MFINQQNLKFACSLLAVVIITTAGGIVHGAQEDKDAKKKQFVMTEAQLQSHIMSYADRLTSILDTTLVQFESQELTEKTRYEVIELMTYSLYHAYIIAGESDPDVALLDMLSMITLGRIFFEEEGPSRYGKVVAPVTKGYQKAEADIRKIAAKVLTPNQMLNLMTIIKRWRMENPELKSFPFMRFSNFAAERRDAALTRAEEPEGLFESVESASESVEEMRLLAERSMYLATRMPQLTGLLGDLWLTRWSNNPDLKKSMADLTQLSTATASLAAVSEKLPENIAKERKAAITQAMSEFSAERKATLDVLLAEERRLEERVTSLMIETMERAERQGKELVDHTLKGIAILIVIGLVGYMIVRLIILFASNKMKPKVKSA
jgi:hypothetical protein